MNTTLRGIARLYRAMLRLYPIPFYTEFASEMASVFVTSLADAARCGPTSVLALCAREFSEYPANLIREHWSIHKEVSMRIWNGALWGAIGFGLATTLIAILPIVLRGFSFGGYLIAGAVGGALFALGGPSRNHLRLYALIGMATFGVGYWLLGAPRLISPSASPFNALIMVSLLLEPALFGMMFGALIGFTQQERGKAARLALSSFVDFGIIGRVVGLLCVIVYWGIAQAINSYQPGNTGRPDEWVVAGLLVMIRYGSTIIAAIIGGAFLGYRVNRHHPVSKLAQAA